MAHINLVKICVGADEVADLEAWQAKRARRSAQGHPMHVTRMWPRRAEALLDGGSIYWVFRGYVLARQRILGLEPVIGQDGITRCGLVLAAELTRVRAVPRKPFQGWRYLTPEQSPPDLRHGADDEAALPPALSAALEEVGVR